MTSTQLNLIAPLDAPLPPPLEGEVFTAAQWITLMAIADTVIPAIEVSSAPSKSRLCVQASEYMNAISAVKRGVAAEADDQLPQAYLQENASSVPGFQELLRRTLGDFVREDARKGIRVILSALE